MIMDAQHVWADRGQSVELNDEQGLVDARWLGVSRLANLRLGAPLFSIWLQIRGNANVDAKEGSFRLTAGDWIAFERESQPELQTDRMGLTLGLVLSADVLRNVTQSQGHGLFAGRGRIPKGERTITLRLWREAMQSQLRTTHATTASQARLMQPLLMQLSLLQRDLASRLGRCPGRSRNRKGQVFGRLQRARLFLEGHCDRVVSLTELADLTSFSSWYFSKTFHSIYDESPQAASQRMRLERACELLAGTSLVIGEVGAACGFDNACSFARAFRSYTGMTASAYREQARRAAPNPANASNVARKAAGSAYT